MSYWSAGDLIVERHIRQGKIWGITPRVVVCDGPDLLAVYTPTGTLQQVGRPLDGGSPRLIGNNEPWELIERPWVGAGVLVLMLPKVAHAIYCFWQPEEPRTFSCWYINLQKPLRRTAIGFDTLDQTLDVVMTPDRASWQWKDEDELDELVRRGIALPNEAQRLHSEGLRAVALLQAADSPYSPVWANWSPDPLWPVPHLPSSTQPAELPI